MATVSIPAGRLVRLLEAVHARTITGIADEAIGRGQPVYRKTNGNFGLARANALGTAKLVGIATKDAAIGRPVEALFYGRMVGYDFSSTNPGTTIFLSSGTAGALDNAAITGTGNVLVPVGTVHVMTDDAQTRYLFVDIPQNANPAALP